MSPADLRLGVLLFLPVVAVFAGLVGLGSLPGGTAAFAAFLTCAGIGLGIAGVRTKLTELQVAQEQTNTELHEEFVRQARLAESYETILDAVPEPVLVLTAERRVLHANRALVDLLGHDPIDADLTAAIRNPGVIEAADAVLAGRVPERSVEYSRGGQVEQYILARLVGIPGGRPKGPALVIALHDLTAIRKTLEMRAEFVANVSHELRTPLSTIVGFVETLRGPAKGDAKARENFLALMDEQGRRMTRLVEDLLSLSQIQANEHTRPTGTVRVQEVLPAVARVLEPEAGRKNMKIAIDAAPDLPAVTGDSDQLMQVFQNLMHNAVKYGRDGTRVSVVARDEGQGALAVAVNDRGDGIPEQHIPRLTERFYRVDKARSRALGGTGLGLAIVKHILNRHQGRLTIESEVGVGSTFTVRLPIRKSGGNPDAQRSPVASDRPS